MDFRKSLARFLTVTAVSATTLSADVMTITLPFDPASVGATKTAFRWSILCDAKTRTSNLDQQPSWMISGSTVTVTLIAGTLVCYQFWYMTDALVPVGQPSAILLLRVPLSQLQRSQPHRSVQKGVAQERRQAFSKAAK
jgi:hypothetical protein